MLDITSLSRDELIGLLECAPRNFADVLSDKDRDHIGAILGDVYIFWPGAQGTFGFIRKRNPGTDGQWIREANYGNYGST